MYFFSLFHLSNSKNRIPPNTELTVVHSAGNQHVSEHTNGFCLFALFWCFVEKWKEDKPRKLCVVRINYLGFLVNIFKTRTCLRFLNQLLCMLSTCRIAKLFICCNISSKKINLITCNYAVVAQAV